jgi:hypothetical protein
MKKKAILLLFTLFPGILCAQKEDYNWVLSDHIRLNFNQGDPTVITDIPISEKMISSTSISDKDGNLLFYTNKNYLYNYKHQKIFTSLAMVLRRNQNVVPHPSLDKNYYWINGVGITENKLAIYTVDMNANAGLGAVSESFSLIGNEVPNSFCIARIANSTDYWFIRFFNKKIVVNPLTDKGLGKPVPNDIAIDWSQVEVKVSPDMSKLLVRASDTLYALDINSLTGEFTNLRKIYSCPGVMYFEFSHSGEFVYLATIVLNTGEITISQLSMLNTDNETNFTRTEKKLYHHTSLAINHQLRDIQLASNRKIYLALGDYYLWSIDNADRQYPYCKVDTQSVWLGGSMVQTELPHYFHFSSNFNYQRYCNSVKFNYLGATPSSFLWDFGDGQTSTLKTPTHLFSQSGLYTVSLTVNFANGYQQTTTKEIEIKPKLLNKQIEHR